MSPNLTRKLVLEAPVRSPDGAGGFDETWEAQGVLWAEMRPRSGRERSGGPGALSMVSYRITVRAAPEGAPSRPRVDQRFRDGVRLFRILAVADAFPDGRFLTCFAEEEVAA